MIPVTCPGWSCGDLEPDGAVARAVGAGVPVGEGGQDGQAAPAVVVVAGRWLPGAAVVFDVDVQVPGGVGGADGELAAGAGGVAVLDGVGGHFGQAQ